MDLQDASPNRRHTRRTARAKVNLALAVDKPNAEAMHPICSWMARINLADDLHITRLEDDRLSRYAIRWHDEAPIKTNIDWSITADLAVRAGATRSAHMRLDQLDHARSRIDVDAGLGVGQAVLALVLHLAPRVAARSIGSRARWQGGGRSADRFLRLPAAIASTREFAHRPPATT